MPIRPVSVAARPEFGAQRNGLALEEEYHGSQKFSWSQAWYPVEVERNIPVDRPTAVRLLGNALVLWKDNEKWRCFQDLCPHRLAPLSEGRVENNSIVCSYHGWAFEGKSGGCVKIPQAVDDRSFQTATSSKRSCVAHYPCEVEDGLVWVFGSCEAGAEEASRRIPRVTVPQLSDPACTHFAWFMRDMPYGADVLMENVIDPSHVPHSHHGIQGNRFKVPKNFIKPAETNDSQKGFFVEGNHTPDVPEKEKNPGYPFQLSFTPPSLVRYSYKTGGSLITYAVPTDPMRSRIFFTFAVKKARMKKLASFMFSLFNTRWLEWKTHLTRNNVLDGDNVFLAKQDQELADRGRRGVKEYYMPTSMDAGVTALRHWFSHHATAFPWGKGAMPAPNAFSRSRQDMLDRYEQHTKHCPSCLMAHKVFSSLRWLAAAAALASAALVVHVVTSSLHWSRPILPALGTLLAAWIAKASNDNTRKLEFEDYRHPDH